MKPYTHADVELVARALHNYPGDTPFDYYDDAKRALDALAAAGRLSSALDHIAGLAIAYVNEPVENTDRVSELYYELEAAVRNMAGRDIPTNQKG